MIRAGKLRHKVTFQRFTTTQNSFGETVETWEDHAERSAAIEPLSGKEYWDAQQTTAETSVRVRVRHDSTTEAITSKDRIAYDGRTLEIVSPPIRINERRREIHFMCREIE